MQLHRVEFQAMGSACEMLIYASAPSLAKQAADRAVLDVLRIEARYSRYRDDNVMASINRAATDGESIVIDDETAGLIEYAATCHRESQGLFDITSGVLRKAWDFKQSKLPEAHVINALLPKVGWHKVIWDRPQLSFTQPGMELDLGGIGKEYAADRTATICHEMGIHHGLVNLGGDIRVIGPHPDGSPWRIGIRHPRMPEALLASVVLSQGGLASSGDYERCIEIAGQRYSHLLDPNTGWPVQGLAAVSVIARQCLVAGTTSTIALLKGLNGIHWLTELGLPHVWIDQSGRKGGSILEIYK